jgi:hypothetical protein
MGAVPLILAVSAALLSAAAALPTTPAKLPNVATAMPGAGLPCLMLGHVDCVAGGPRNQFGLDFKDMGKSWNEKFCMTDSDGDGLTNGEELGDPCCMWTPENTNPPGFRTTMLSHPGDKAESGASSVPKATCPIKPTITSPKTTLVPVTSSSMTCAKGMKKPVKELLLLVVKAGSDGMTGKRLMDGSMICPKHYGEAGFGIVAMAPYKPDYVQWGIDGKKIWREKYSPWSLSGDKLSNGASRGITPWKSYPADGTEFVVKASTQQGELALKLVIKCDGDMTTSPTTVAPSTTALTLTSNVGETVETATGAPTTTKEVNDPPATMMAATMAVTTVASAPDTTGGHGGEYSSGGY